MFWVALFFLFLIFFILFFDLVVSILTVIVFRGAFFAKSSPKRIKNILKLANIKPGQKVVDLGSGDGRVVIAFAQKKALVMGFEVNPWLVWKSRLKIKKLCLQNRAKIVWKSFWQTELSKFNVIVVYGINYMMKKLEKKILKETKKGTKIISVYFKFPNLKIKQKLGDVYLY